MANSRPKGGELQFGDFVVSSHTNRGWKKKQQQHIYKHHQNRGSESGLLTKEETFAETRTERQTVLSLMQRGNLEIDESVFHNVLKKSPIVKMDNYNVKAAKNANGSCNGVIFASPQVEIPDYEKDERFCVLSYEQVRRLHDLMSDTISIHGRGNFPTIEVRLCDLVSCVRSKLELDQGVRVKEVRLNGSGASSVLANDGSDITYNDLDLIFAVQDLSTGRAYDRVKCAVLDALMQLLPEGVSRKRMSSCSMKEAYVSKMVKVNDTDRWSLITLGNNRSKTVELKFVHTMKRQYEFSVDSFHILLDTLFLFYDCSSGVGISDNFYPTVVGESMFGDFNEALCHLHNKLIATRSPEEIRGGGLLKYCNLLCKGYRPASPEGVKKMERYMCSRFFIDFPDIVQQQAKLDNYLLNHFQSSEDSLKYEYLMILYQVVDESTVCLMGHERKLTLGLIENLAYRIYTPPSLPEQESTSSAASISSSASSSSSSTTSSSDDPNLLSPMSMSDASSTISSASSSGYTTPQKVETPGPATTTTVITTLSHHQQPQLTPSSLIPTYEIVTSCQPAVVYSNGCYYTSFVSPPTSASTTSSTTCDNGVPTTAFQTPPPPPHHQQQPQPCLACSCNNWVISTMPPPQQHYQQQNVVVSHVLTSVPQQQQQQQQRHHHHHQQQPEMTTAATEVTSASS